jgi:hypothetical protein
MPTADVPAAPNVLLVFFTKRIESQMSKRIRIKNWRKFQHFKNRRPPWVKLYRELLDDPEWHDLDPAAAKFLVTLWLLASEDEKQEGRLPDPKTIAFRLRLTEKEAKQRLAQVSSWLEQDDITTISPRYQDGPPETETETETETYLDSTLRADHKKRRGKSGKAKTIPLPADWQPNASAIALANSLNVDLADAEARFLDYLKSSGKEYADYDAAFRNHIRNTPKFNGLGKHVSGSRQLQDDKLSVSRAADRLIDATREGKLTFAPLPSLVPDSGESHCKLLPKG